MSSTMRGYNGNLSLTRSEVRIERGLKALLVRKKWSAERRFLYSAIREVWFQPSSGRWGWPGYVLLIDEADAPLDGFVARVRDDRAVTFLNRTDEWRSLAEAIAAQCAVPLREFPAERRGAREVVTSAAPDADYDARL